MSVVVFYVSSCIFLHWHVVVLYGSGFLTCQWLCCLSVVLFYVSGCVVHQ